MSSRERSAAPETAARRRPSGPHRPAAAGARLEARDWSDGGPLSFTQQRLWFFDRFDPGHPVYNIARAYRLEGPLDAGRLERAVATVAARHPALRTVILEEAGGPRQRVLDEVDATLHRADLPATGAESREEALRRALLAGSRWRFDLRSGPLFRCSLVRLGSEHHVLQVVHHHIVSDGWSVDRFLDELGAVYDGTRELPELRVQPLDAAAWQRERLESGELEEKERFWLETLAGHPPLLTLPSDRPRPEVQRFEGARCEVAFPDELTERIRARARALRATPFMVLLAGYASVLGRLAGQDDVVVGTPFAGRDRVELEPLIGFFADTLPIRIRLDGGPSFAEVVDRTRSAVLQALGAHEVPFDRIVERLQPERSAAATPVFQTLLGYQTGTGARLELTGLRVTHIPVDPGTSRTDLTVTVHDVGGRISGLAELDTALFEPDTIRDLVARWMRLLEAGCTDPELEVSRIPLLAPDERRWLVEDLNRTASEYPRDASIQELFARVAATRPDAAAVEHGDAVLSFSELDRRARRVAASLQGEAGVRPGDVVALCVGRSPELVIGMLGILDAGAAYLPVDPEDPPGRIRAALEDAGATVAVATAGDADRLPVRFERVVTVEGDGGPGPDEPAAPDPVAGSGDDVAYVMFTSGSTGRPKGVAIPHRGVVRLVRGTDYLQLDAGDRVAQVATASFDAATFEIWGPLLTGGTVVILDREDVLSPIRLADALRERRITAMFLTVTLFNQVVRREPAAFAPLRALLVGGEALDPRWIRELLAGDPPARLLNGYGPTESTTFAVCFQIDSVPDGARSIPIGFPIANTTAHVLDRHMEPVPVGVEGELYLGGDGLAVGYVNRPELTAEAFVPDPFDPAGRGRLYRTGDVARRRRDGAIEFVGRTDQQVKIRGFRIEPGEVEAALAASPDVAAAAVVAHRAEDGGDRLVAYAVPAAGRSPDARDLRAFLERRVPSYMVPSEIVLLDEMPLSATGKVDRAALPEPAFRGLVGGDGPEPPRDRLEASLVEIWQRLLGTDRVGIRDSFFDLGGHSILAVRLLTEVSRSTGEELPLASLFRAPTVESMAEMIRSRGWRDDWELLVTMRRGDDRPPMVWIHSAGGNLLTYHDVTSGLDPAQPVLGIQAVGLDGGSEPLEAVEEMAERYLDELRATGVRPPLHLGGMSFGGLVAYEMARRLRAAGEPVGVVALLDTNPRLDRGVPRLARWRRRWAVDRQRLRYHLGNLMRLPWPEKATFVRRRLHTLRRRTSFYLGGLAARWHRQLGAPLPPALYNVARSSYRAAVRYRAPASDVRVTLFRARDRNVVATRDPLLGWGPLAGGGVEVHEIPGQHHTMTEPPHVHELAATLQQCLDRATAQRNG